MEMVFFNFCYIVGMISFTLTGFWNCYKQKQFHIALLCTILSAFGGGMVFRDIILLRTIPGAIIEKTELMMVMFFTVWLIHISTHFEGFFSMMMKLRLVQALLHITDALGSGAFISIGYLKALQYNLPAPLCVVSGVVTTFGGGVLAALVRGTSLKTVLTSSLGYRVIVIANALFFNKLQSQGVPESTARCIVITSMVFLCVGRSLLFTKSSSCQCKALHACHLTPLDKLHINSLVMYISVIYAARHCTVMNKHMMEKYYHGQATTKNLAANYTSLKSLIRRPTVFCVS